MRKTSSGLLIYKIKDSKIKFFLVHPGGPFWKDKNEGTWGIPKGEINDGEDLLKCAIREVKEETGLDMFNKDFIDLGSVIQKSGKEVFCWACESDWSGLLMGSSFVEMEHPSGSGKKIRFPEVDRADFFDIDAAKNKINPAQFEFLERLKVKLGLN